MQAYIHREIIFSAYMNSCYFKSVFFLKYLNKENTVKITALQFDLTCCTVTETKIDGKSNKTHVRSTTDFKITFKLKI